MGVNITAEFVGGTRVDDVADAIGISPKSSAEKIALGKALVRFFGGWIDYNDSDTRAVNFRAKPHPQLHATNGKPWQQFEQSMWDLKPLTAKDVAKVAKWAAY